MFSRAHLLVEREFDKIKKNGLSHGITAYQVSDESIFEWIVKLKGLKGSRWEDGIFRIYVKFTEHYNSRPPEICFHTIPFHPNVDPITGRPCIEFLDNPSRWDPSTSLLNVFLTIQLLLSNPVIEKAVNGQAAQLYVKRPAVYHETVADCVVASQRLDMGLDPYAIKNPIPVLQEKPTSRKEQNSAPRTQHTFNDIITKVSFDEYHHAWKGMATSLPSQKNRNEYVDNVKTNPSLAEIHSGMAEEERIHRDKLQMMEHKNLYRGRVKGGNDNLEWKDTRVAELEKMKKLYLREHLSSAKTPDHEGILNKAPANTPRLKSSMDHALWDNEVDELVAWTASLDDSHL